MHIALRAGAMAHRSARFVLKQLSVMGYDDYLEIEDDGKDDSNSDGSVATPLTTAVLESCYYGENRHAVVNKIIKMLIRRYTVWDEDDAFSDFLIRFHPRIAQLVTKYEFYGTPFEHYIMHAVRLSFKKYKMSKRRNSHYIRSYETFHAQSKNVDTHDTDFDLVPIMLDILNVHSMPLNDVQKRRVLILCLKFSHWIKGEHVQYIARLVKYDYGRLLLLVEVARLRAAERSMTISLTIERRNRMYGSLMKAHCTLNAYWMRDRHDADCNRNIVRYRHRLQEYNEKITSRQFMPTNDFVATILNIPKGAVDSNLHVIKRKYIRWQKTHHSQYDTIDEDRYCYQQYS